MQAVPVCSILSSILAHLLLQADVGSLLCAITSGLLGYSLLAHDTSTELHVQEKQGALKDAKQALDAESSVLQQINSQLGAHSAAASELERKQADIGGLEAELHVQQQDLQAQAALLEDLEVRACC